MKVVAWGIFDSQGFYETRETEAEALEFCNHYNDRDFKAYGARPYSYKPLIAAPSAGEVQLWCEGLHRAATAIDDQYSAFWLIQHKAMSAFFGESTK